MATLNKTTMALPTPNPNDFDITKIVEFVGVLITIFTGYLVWINKYFKDKERQSKAFIEAIASGKVDMKLTDFETKMKLFDEKLTHLNDTLVVILREIKAK